MMLLVFDGLLLLVAIVLAWGAVHDRDLFRAVIKFIVFGLLVSVAWVRLRAPDVALAEAAVGSGLTGALLLSALVRMRRRERAAARRERGGVPMISRPLPALLALTLFGVLGWAVLSLPRTPAGLAGASLDNLAASGVENPVTAVLLNYRAYDTLLEVGVLLLALVAVWALRVGEWPGGDRQNHPLLLPMLRVVLPVLVLAAGHLLWIGAFAPGGAFQGGALLGGALVLVLLAGAVGRLGRRVRMLRASLVAGVLVFLAAAAATTLITGGMLQYPAGQGGAWILVIEAAALVSIGMTLGLLYLGGRPPEPPDGAARSETLHDA